MFGIQSGRSGLVAAVAAVAMSSVAQATPYYYSGYDSVTPASGTVNNPVSGVWSDASQSTFYLDSAGATPAGAAVTPVSTLTGAPSAQTNGEIYFGGVAEAANYTASIPSGNASANVIVLSANNAGTNTLEFLHTGSNRLSLATPGVAQTFSASIQQQGSANWIFTNPGNASAALRFANSFTISGAGSGNISIPFIISNTNSAVNASVSLTGGATLTLGGLNLFGGTGGQSFTLTNGRVDFQNSRAFGNAGNQIRLNGGTLLSSTGTTITTYNATSAGTAGSILIGGNVTFAGTTSWGTGTNSVTLTGNRTITANNTGTTGTTIGGVIGQSAAGFGLTIGATSTGTLRLSAVNTYTGATTVNGGTLLYGVANTLPAAGAVAVNGGTLNLAAFNGTVGAATLQAGTISSTTGILTPTSLDLQSGSVSAIIGGAGTVTKSTAGTVVLTGVNTYTATTTINAGTLQLGDGTTGHDGTIAATADIVNNGALVYNRFGAVSSDRVISGTGTVTKSGVGTQTLTGANTYTGVTTVTAGTLVLGTDAQSPVLTGAGGADVQSGSVVFQYPVATSNAATIRGLLQTSYAAGFLTGQIKSTTATTTHGLGYKDDAANNQVIVKATLYGDADLSGNVGIDDFNALAVNFGATTGKVWTEGDFTYDGAVGIDDFNKLAVNFGTALPAADRAEAMAGLMAFAIAHDDLPAFYALTGVPEPTSLGLLTAGAVVGLRRRRTAC